jgi:tetratricopeptide (TPR) repeat protein
MDYDVTEYSDVLDGLGDKVVEDPFADEVSAAWQLHLASKNEQALARFDEVLRQDPDHMDALYGKGLALKKLGRKDKAVAAFQRVLDLLDTIRADMPGRSSMLERLSKRHIQWLQIS